MISSAGPTVPVSGAPAPGPVIPPIATVSLSLNVPGSQNMFSLSREDTCAVKRSVGIQRARRIAVAGRTAEVRLVEPLGAVAGVLVVVHAREIVSRPRDAGG